MDNHPIDNLMKHTMEELKGMIDVNTIVGNPVTSVDGTVIIPISKVSFGFASGGSEFCSSENYKESYPFGGGSGAGVSLKPVAFLIVKKDSIRLLNLDNENYIDKLMDIVPQAVDTIKNMFSQDDEKDNKSSDSKNTDSNSKNQKTSENNENTQEYNDNY